MSKEHVRYEKVNLIKHSSELYEFIDRVSMKFILI